MLPCIPWSRKYRPRRVVTDSQARSRRSCEGIPTFYRFQNSRKPNRPTGRFEPPPNVAKARRINGYSVPVHQVDRVAHLALAAARMGHFDGVTIGVGIARHGAQLRTCQRQYLQTHPRIGGRGLQAVEDEGVAEICVRIAGVVVEDPDLAVAVERDLVKIRTAVLRAGATREVDDPFVSRISSRSRFLDPGGMAGYDKKRREAGSLRAVREDGYRLLRRSTAEPMPVRHVPG